MQHPEFEEAPARLPDPIGYPQPDGKSALEIDPELIKRKEQAAPIETARARASSSCARSARARAHRETGEPSISQGI